MAGSSSGSGFALALQNIANDTLRDESGEEGMVDANAGQKSDKKKKKKAHKKDKKHKQHKQN